MAPSTEQDPGYLFYRKYTDLKNEFKKKVKPNDTPSYWDDCLKHVNTISNEKLPYEQKIFKHLINHFSQFTIFYSHQASDCCKYINFWLNNEIRTSYGEVPSSKFSIFKDFAYKYSDVKYSNQIQSCEPYLNYLDDEKYKKITLLYDLYHKYDEIISPPTNPRSTACITLNLIIKHYNAVIEDYFKHDRALFDKLNNFKGLITKLNLDSISKCKWNLSLFEAPDEDKKRQDEQLKMEAKMLAERRSSPELRVEALDTTQTQLQQELTKSPQVQEETISVETHTEYDNHRESTNHHARYNHRTEMDSINEISPPHEAPHVGLFPKRPQLQLKGQEYVQPPEFSNDVAKDSSTILSSITGFINEVEPAPILGVSGGMGALFLLFKYTPVGTFFRGGRRINNRIPRTFYGQIAGGLAGYDDFYEGGFGPGPINISYRPELE
ncbi:unnamed protein product [Plasmodium vivax]|uniref:(malaria parasite P. vivax) hypothetical protein n=1 Tax=Plasmodium vivax TaxID=5855 RepID=A0A8S4H952_PLAVI|nr:unnamed protein product [Plasmodium vivax]